MTSLVTTALLLASVVSASAQQPMLWKHNDSIVSPSFDDRDILTIRYVDPRNGLEKAGIRPGTILLQTNPIGRQDDFMFATAYTFKGGCKPAPYLVIGHMSDQNTRMTFMGAAPVRKKDGCDIQNFDWRIPAAALVFTVVKFE